MATRKHAGLSPKERKLFIAALLDRYVPRVPLRASPKPAR